MTKTTDLFESLPFINVTEFANFIGMNPGLMRRYACGESTPSEKQAEKIRCGLVSICEEIQKFTS